MQGKSEPEYATKVTGPQPMLGRWRCSHESTRPPPAPEALGISIVIESVVLALLIVAPLMTSVAHSRNLTESFRPCHSSWGIGNLTMQAGTLCHTRFTTTLLFVPGFSTAAVRYRRDSHQDAEQNADSILDSPGEYIQAQFTNQSRSARLPVEPPSIDTHKPTRKAP